MKLFRQILGAMVLILLVPLYILMVLFEYAIMQSNEDINIVVDDNYNCTHFATYKWFMKLYDLIAGNKI